MLKKLLLLSMPLALMGCATTSTNLGSVSLNKAPVYPHAYQERIKHAIQPALKELKTDNFYKVSDPHRLEYKVHSNLWNAQTFDGYAVCYMVGAKNEFGMHKENRLFLFILDGDKILHSTYQMPTNFLETSRIYSTCSKIQQAQGKR